MFTIAPPEAVTTDVTPDEAVEEEITRADLISAIRAEAADVGVRCSAGTAKALIWSLENAARDCVIPGDVYYFSQRELDRMHHVLDVVMPDDTVATLGSAYALLQRGLLGPNQVAFTHTRRIRDGEPGAVYCCVYVGVLVV
jgi:hypothetical protein